MFCMRSSIVTHKPGGNYAHSEPALSYAKGQALNAVKGPPLHQIVRLARPEPPAKPAGENRHRGEIPSGVGLDPSLWDKRVTSLLPAVKPSKIRFLARERGLG
jgi:hypothetical protein